MAIDDRIEKIRGILDEQDDDVLAALVPLGAIFAPILSVCATAKSILDAKECRARIVAALRALCDELQSMQKSLPGNAESALKSIWFRRAVQVVIEESMRAASEEYAATLARAVAHGCFPDDENKHRQEDLASYIEDIARLGADDIQMLKLLRDAYATAIRNAPQMDNPNIFANEYDGYVRRAGELKIHPDDRIALGARLCGFGLAYESPTQPFPGQHFVRPTRRGLYLLSLLDAAETPSNKRN